MTPVPTKLVPLGNRVLLRKIEANVRGGLLVPQSSEIDEGTQEFEVAAISAEAKTCYYDKVGFFGVGDRIYLARHKGWKIETSSGDELYVAEVDDILALVVEASAVEETPLNGDQP